MIIFPNGVFSRSYPLSGKSYYDFLFLHAVQRPPVESFWQHFGAALLDSFLPKPAFDSFDFARWKTLDEINQISKPLHRLNPIWKPRKAPLASVIRAKNTVPKKKPANFFNF